MIGLGYANSTQMHQDLQNGISFLRTWRGTSEVVGSCSHSVRQRMRKCGTNASLITEPTLTSSTSHFHVGEARNWHKPLLRACQRRFTYQSGLLGSEALEYAYSIRFATT